MDNSYEITRREHLVRKWLMYRNQPLQLYSNLTPENQEILRDHISRISLATYNQLKVIDEQLRSSDTIVGRFLKSNMTPDELYSYYSLPNEQMTLL